MLPIIDGRDVLPVRLIVYYTSSRLGPEGISLLLAHQQGVDWNRHLSKEDELTAYHLLNGKKIALRKAEWDGIHSAIKSLSGRFDYTNRHFTEWLAEALKILPIAFVWRDEFDSVYYRAMSPDRISFANELTPKHDFLSEEEKEIAEEIDRKKYETAMECDKDERETNGTPYIPADLRTLVFEGFTHLIHVEKHPLPGVSEAAKVLKSQQTTELYGITEQIMKKISELVQEVVNSRGDKRTINHMRLLREAGVPPEKLDAIRKKVKYEFKRKYEDAGFKLLSRRPKDGDPYLLP